MKLYSSLQIDEIGTKIAAKIKAIMDKTNLLKTAAYKDVGTTAGKIPEFVGNDGIGGFGFGGSAKKLAVGADLDLLPRVNALYTGTKAKNIIGIPSDLARYIFDYEFLVECVVGDGASTVNGAYMQRFIFDAFPPGTTSSTNSVIFVRTRSYLGFSPWVRLTGKMNRVDSGGLGADAEYNSIKVGDTSPKVAFETKVLQITYDPFRYNPDGSYKVNSGSSGYESITTTIPVGDILSMSCRVYMKQTSGAIVYVDPKSLNSYKYYELTPMANGFLVRAKNSAHATDVGATGESAQMLYDSRGFVELFVTYRVN